jgi:glyoxylase-like metal-dependent hydrolase (beta-lactamase superfamily II)
MIAATLGSEKRPGLCPAALSWQALTARALRLAVLLALALAGVPPPSAQEAPRTGYRAAFAKAREAFEKRDYPAYLRHMNEAMSRVSRHSVARPYLMYHLARAYALAGNKVEALRWLEGIWSERIESLMVSYVAYDPAYDAMRESPEFVAFVKKMYKPQIEMLQVRGKVWRLDGAGCTVAASIGSDGVLLVDSGYGPAAEAIRAALVRAGGGPVRFIVSTHQHEDHVAGNGVLGPNAWIVAHRNVRKGLLVGQPFIQGGVIVPPKPAEVLPDLTLEQPVSLFFNGEEVRILPLPAHTDGDVVVVFVGSKVVHMGDNFFPEAQKLAFIWPGDRITEFVLHARRLLEQLPEQGSVLSGHNPPTTMGHLRRCLEATLEAIEFVRQRVEQGKSFEEIRKESLPAQWTEAGGGAPLQWLEEFYNGLKQSQAPPP